MKLVFILIFVSFFSKQDIVFAQAGLIQGANDPSKADLKALTDEGRLAHIVVTPQEKKMDYYVVGTKEGEINFNNLKLFNNQMNPLPSQYTEDKNPVKSNAEPIVKLRRLRHNVTPRVAQRANIPLPVKKYRNQPTSIITASHAKKTSGFSEMSFMMILLLLLCIALYAYRSSLKMRRNQTARVLP